MLDDGGFLLWESRAILQYLADKTPAQSLYPADARARADVNRWLFRDAAHLAPAVGVVVFERMVKRITGRGEPDPAEIRGGEALVAQVLPVLDGQLATTEWLSGGRTTLADVSVATTLALAGAAGINLEPFAHIVAWHTRMRALDAWKATEPPPRG